MKKVIFIDVDGTLISYTGKLPESTVVAIRQARKNGHRVYICTGRSEAEVYDYIWEIGLDGMIGGNGSYVKDGNDVIMWQRINQAQCKHIVDWCYSRNLEFYLEANDGLYASKEFETKGEPVIRLYADRKGKARPDYTVRQAFPNMIFGEENLYRDVNKVSFILNSYQDHLDSIREFPDLQAGTWGGEGEIALFGDLGVKDIDKGRAIDILLEHIGANIEDTIAIGDAKVDIPMLEKCHVGIAVGSGGDEIKAMADYVTDAVEDDGIYKAFQHFGLL